MTAETIGMKTGYAALSAQNNRISAASTSHALENVRFPRVVSAVGGARTTGGVARSGVLDLSVTFFVLQ